MTNATESPSAGSAGGGDAPSSRQILALAIPALGALAAEPLLGLLDTAFLGRVGTAELAALGAANALISLIATSLIFIEYGTTSRIAHLFGAGDREAATDEAIQVGWLATILGVGVTVVLVGFARHLLVLLDVAPRVLDVGVTYLTIRGFASIPALWIRAGNGVFRGLQDTRTPFLIVLGMNVWNAILDPILIFGVAPLGIPAMGIAGAAWASLSASVFGGVAFVLVLARRLDVRGASSFRLWPRWDVLRSLFGTSRDLLLRTLGLQFALFTGTRMAAGFGTPVLAAHQVAWQLWAFLALLLDSLAIAGQALVGRALGEGRAARARAVGNRLCLWGLGLGLVLSSVFLVARRAIPRIFTDEEQVLMEIDRIFVLLALMQIPNAILFVLDGLLIGASDMRFLRNSMIALGIFGVITAWLGGRLGGDLLGVWIGISTFMVARLVVMAARWRSAAWMKGRS